MQDNNTHNAEENENYLSKLTQLAKNDKEDAELKRIVSRKIQSTDFEQFGIVTVKPQWKPYLRYSIAAVLVLFAVTITFLIIFPNQKQISIAIKQDSTTIQRSPEKFLSDSVSITKKKDTLIERNGKNHETQNQYANDDKYKIWGKTDSHSRAFGKMIKENTKDYNLLDSYSIPVGRYGSGFHDSLKKILSSLGYNVNETKNGEGNKALETEPQSAYFNKYKNDIPYKIRIENDKEKSIKVKLFEQQKNKNFKFPKSKSTVDELYYKELRDRLEKSFKDK